MDAITIDPSEARLKEWLRRGFSQDAREHLKPDTKPNRDYEKLEDISPAVFEEVLFGERRSPAGWRCLRRSPEPSPNERQLWHQIVARALSTGDYGSVALLVDEFDSDTLDDLSRYVLLQEQPGNYGLRHVLVEIVSDGNICIIALESKCVAIYA